MKFNSRYRLVSIISILLLLTLMCSSAFAFPTPDVDFPDFPGILLPPSNLTATTVSGSEITLTWADNSNIETGFCIERKQEGAAAFSALVTLGQGITTYADTGLEENTTYAYRVKAIGDNGSTDYSNEASATTKAVISIPTFLKAPSDLTAKAVSGKQQITLVWTDNTIHELNFSVERKSGSGSFAVICQLPADTKTYTDATVAFGTAYTYRVQALGNGQKIKNSPYSNEANASTDSFNLPLTPVHPYIPLPSLKTTVMRFYIGSTDFYVNDQLQTMDSAPVINQGRTVLPIKYVATALGATVDWYASERKVVISMNNKVIELWIDTNVAKVNGQETLIDPNNANVKPVILPPGRTMLPLRFITEELGCAVDWNQTTQEVKITYPK